MEPKERPTLTDMFHTDWPTLSGVIARNVKRRRQELNWNQGDLAEAMALMGWTPTTVTWTETGRRQIRADEMLRLCLVLGVTPDYFAEGDGMYRNLEGQPPMPLRELRNVLTKPKEPVRLPKSGQVVRDEERKAAAKIGIGVTLLRRIASGIWEGRSLIEERERRLGDTAGQAARSLQAKRGRITRELVDEVQRRYDDMESQKLASRKSRELAAGDDDE